MKDRYEAVVIGSGIVGLSLAIKLVEKNVRTLLIDRCREACGATRYSGGVFTRILDDEEEYNWALESHKFYMKYLGKADFVNWGYLIIEKTSLVIDDYKDYKMDIKGLKIVYPEEIPDILGIDVKLEDEMGLLIEKDFTINPGRLVDHLKDVYLDKGGEFLQTIYKGYKGDNKEVLLENGEVSFEKLFICLGPWGEEIPGRYKLTRLISIPIYKFDVKINVGYWDETLYGYFRVEDGSMVGGFYDAYPIVNVEEGFGIPNEESIDYTLERISMRLGYKPKIIDMWRAPVALSIYFKPFHIEVGRDIYVFNGFGGRGIILGPGYIEGALRSLMEPK